MLFPKKKDQSEFEKLSAELETMFMLRNSSAKSPLGIKMKKLGRIPTSESTSYLFRHRSQLIFSISDQIPSEASDM